MKKYILHFILLNIVTSCISKSNNYTYDLSSSEKYFKISTKGSINPYTFYLTFYENNDSAWLFYGNSMMNELIIFTYPEGDMYKRIQFEREGPQGIGSYRGVHVHNLDSIFIASGTFVHQFFLTDTSGIIKKRYQISDINNTGIAPCIKPFFNHIGNVGNVQKNKINLSCYYPYAETNNNALPNEIIDFTYDFGVDSIVSYSYYPKVSFKTERNLSKYSRTYNGEKFVYSLDYSDNIFFKNSNENYAIKFCKSIYRMKNIENRDPDNRELPINIQMKHSVESPQYYSLVFDKHRKCYYRFFNPGTDVKNIDNIEKMWEYPNRFSIMIIDKQLNIVGETMLPKRKYNPFMSFVNQDGLFLALHVDHPLYSHDSLSFELIDLKLKEK